MIANSLRKRFAWLLHAPESGQTLVEYGLIIALLALVGFVGVVALHGGVGQLYGTVQDAADAMQHAIS